MLDDPYDDRIEMFARFEIISDRGSRYSFERVSSRRWHVSRIETGSIAPLGHVTREGTVLNFRYGYKRADRWLSAGWQNGFMNACFGLIGELEA